jgi:hypothetical protein
MKFEIDIIFNDEFNEFMKKKQKFFNQDYQYFAETYLKLSKLKNPTDEEIKQCLQNYINLQYMEILRKIDYNPNLIPYIKNDFAFRRQLLKDTNLHIISFDMFDFYETIADFMSDYVKTIIIDLMFKNIYKTKNNPKIKDAIKKYHIDDIDEMFKNFKNTMENRKKLFLPFSFIKDICSCFSLCRVIDEIDEYRKIANEYKFKEHNYKKINNRYFELFNLLFLTNKHSDICNELKSFINLDKILNKNLKDINVIQSIIDDLSIYIVNQTNLSMISYLEPTQIIFKHFYEIDSAKQNQIYDEDKNMVAFSSNKIMGVIRTCKQKFIVINITLIYDNEDGHANILIFNPNTNEVEIFEPGFNNDENCHKETNNMKKIYPFLVAELFGKKVEYIPQKDYITYNIQNTQENECVANIGHCRTWCIWYVDKRLEYPDKTAKEAFKIISNKYIIGANKTINDTNLTNLIANYVDYIHNQRKELLLKRKLPKHIHKILMEEWFPDGFVYKKV